MESVNIFNEKLKHYKEENKVFGVFGDSATDLVFCMMELLSLVNKKVCLIDLTGEDLYELYEGVAFINDFYALSKEDYDYIFLYGRYDVDEEYVAYCNRVYVVFDFLVSKSKKCKTLTERLDCEYSVMARNLDLDTYSLEFSVLMSDVAKDAVSRYVFSEITEDKGVVRSFIDEGRFCFELLSKRYVECVIQMLSFLTDVDSGVYVNAYGKFLALG